MEQPSISFTPEQAAYLSRVLHELDLRSSRVEGIINSTRILENNNATITSQSNITIPNFSNYFTISGISSVSTLSPRPVGDIITIRLKSGVVLVNSSNLLLNDGIDRVALDDDIIQLISFGNGVWKELAYKFKNGVPSFRVDRNGLNTSGFTAETTLVFTTERFGNVPGAFNSGTGEYVLKIPGVYNITTSFLTVNPNIFCQSILYVNNVNTMTAVQSDNTTPVITNTINIKITSAATLRMAVLFGANNAVQGSINATYMTGHKVE